MRGRAVNQKRPCVQIWKMYDKALRFDILETLFELIAPLRNNDPKMLFKINNTTKNAGRNDNPTTLFESIRHVYIKNVPIESPA